MKLLALPDSTPPNQDPLRALNAHPERMPILLVPEPAKIVILIPTNRNLMLQLAFPCKKGSTNRAQQPKSNARRVKLEVVATHRATIVRKERFKASQVKPPVTNAPPERQQTKAVSNATEPHALRAPIKISLMANAKTVHKAGNQNYWMPRNAPIVMKAPQHRLVVEVRYALGAILVLMAMPRNPVFVCHANPVCFKTSRAKPRVLPAPSARHRTVKQRHVKTRLGARAKLAKNTCMTWDLETNGRAKRALQAPCATQIPAGPPYKS